MLPFRTMSLFTQKGSLTFFGKLGNLMLAVGLFCAAILQGIELCLCPVKHPTCTADCDRPCACDIAHAACDAAQPDDPVHPEAMHHRCEHLYLDTVPPAEYAQRERIRVLIALFTCTLHTNTSITCMRSTVNSPPPVDWARLRIAPSPLTQSPTQRLC